MQTKLWCLEEEYNSASQVETWEHWVGSKDTTMGRHKPSYLKEHCSNTSATLQTCQSTWKHMKYWTGSRTLQLGDANRATSRSITNTRATLQQGKNTTGWKYWTRSPSILVAKNNISTGFAEQFECSLQRFDTTFQELECTLQGFDMTLQDFAYTLQYFEYSLQGFETTLQKFGPILQKFDPFDHSGTS